jgi:hypothetical protein
LTWPFQISRHTFKIWKKCSVVFLSSWPIELMALISKRAARCVNASMSFLRNLIHYRKLYFLVPRLTSRNHVCFYLPTLPIDVQKHSPLYTMCENYNVHQHLSVMFSVCISILLLFSYPLIGLVLWDRRTLIIIIIISPGKHHFFLHGFGSKRI